MVTRGPPNGPNYTKRQPMTKKSCSGEGLFYQVAGSLKGPLKPF